MNLIFFKSFKVIIRHKNSKLEIFWKCLFGYPSVGKASKRIKLSMFLVPEF